MKIKFAVASWSLCFALLNAAKQSGPAGLLSDTGIRIFGSKISNIDTFSNIVNPMLIPRVVGTPGHKAVREHISNWMKVLNWQVEMDTFTDQTPVGAKEFTNVIATLDPKSPRRLVLACHYDSKPSSDGLFVGATDSAVPCGMMMQLALDLRSELAALKRKGSDITLQFIFFDGEEAFVRWGPKDSIYGARHLASKWESTPYPPGNAVGTNELERIDLFILLDLLGTNNPTFYSYFDSSDSSYQRLAFIEDKLRGYRAIPQNVSRRKFFSKKRTFAAIEDDHIPFLQRGVRILHVIPSPFPSVWHTNADDGSAIHWETVQSLGRVFQVFVAEYLALQPADLSP
ncbi:glutaminyl-peptide cyclotransferase-like [Artemia franciscana]|uniref:Glutaminyl-peptide cyclotransferase n=1 Tax=Artemia franciscana TaxID=6661 RepID=A0AA88HKM4_ARTSF|nr:hypothetical protein QYM36_013129 [Artemia franciscana]KAK2709356.1 hypothetical protein QYM36_013129 [Artemia franciscana]KAK2709357.1 hypothetical protein QYM36_013129 [Artemia franciscana]